MYNKIESWLCRHKITAHILLGLEGAAIGIMFALAI